MTYDFDPKKDVRKIGTPDPYDDFPLWEEVMEEKRKCFQEIIAAKEKKKEEDNVRKVPKFEDKDEEFPPLASEEELAAIEDFYSKNPEFKTTPQIPFMSGKDVFHEKEAWIQTFSGRRFNPTNPISESIVIQDIAHALSMQCRFSGHVKEFYSVAQHSVLVSYLTDSKDALWGLLHDASEAYLVDVPRPLKRSGKFDAYLQFEKKVQDAVCVRFNLPTEEPESVKIADKTMLATEARDLMSPLRHDWVQSAEPLPMKILPLGPKEAKNLFMKRFFQLTNDKTSENLFKKYLTHPDSR